MILSFCLQFLYVKNISISFGASQRPGQIKISKSLDGKTFTVWQYVVSLQSECQSVFNVDHNEKPYNIDTVLCSLYTQFVPQSANETVSTPAFFNATATTFYKSLVH